MPLDDEDTHLIQPGKAMRPAAPADENRISASVGGTETGTQRVYPGRGYSGGRVERTTNRGPVPWFPVVWMSVRDAGSKPPPRIVTLHSPVFVSGRQPKTLGIPSLSCKRPRPARRSHTTHSTLIGPGRCATSSVMKNRSVPPKEKIAGHRVIVRRQTGKSPDAVPVRATRCSGLLAGWLETLIPPHGCGMSISGRHSRRYPERRVPRSIVSQQGFPAGSLAGSIGMKIARSLGLLLLRASFHLSRSSKSARSFGNPTTTPDREPWWNVGSPTPSEISGPLSRSRSCSVITMFALPTVYRGSGQRMVGRPGMPRPNRCYCRGPDSRELSARIIARWLAASNDLAWINWNEGRYAEAERLSRRALAIREKALGHQNVETSRNLSDLGGPSSRRASTIRPSGCSPKR